jgi:hypothetical protein
MSVALIVLRIGEDEKLKARIPPERSLSTPIA